MNKYMAGITLPRSILLSTIVLFGAFLLFMGCKSTTKPDPTGSVSGTIRLENDTDVPGLTPTDFSGVRIALYRIAVLDTAIVRINELHPGIGVVIDQETEFDHRFSAPILSAQSGADGAYTLSGIPYGMYNIAFIKQDWAVKYLYNISVTSESVITIPELVIHPARQLPSYIQADYTFQAGETYFVNNPVNFVAPVTFNPGAKIYVAPNASLYFHSAVTTNSPSNQGKFWRIDASQGIYSNTVTTIDSTMYFPSVVFNSSVQNFANGIIRHISSGISFNMGVNTISNLDIKNYNTAFSLNNVGGSFSRLNIRNGYIKAIQGLSLQDALTVTKCIFYKGYDGVIAYMGGGYTIEDNYFYENDTAVRPQNSTGFVRYNNFYANKNDIYQYNAECDVLFNNFYYTRVYTLFPKTLAPIYSAEINNNNFFKTDYRFITLRGTVYSDLNAKDNYWAVSNVDDYLTDALDNASYPGDECPYFVRYLPKKTAKVTTAGIRS